MGFRVLKGGLLTTVQDFGRYGYQSQGFNVSGVMDPRSFRIANLLLDNPENEAVLECTLIGPTLEFTSDQIIAITGGDFRPELNDDPVPMYTAIYVKKGDVLKVGSARTGRTCYIAFSNYLQVPVVMGSRSTNLKCGIGGFKGRKLRDGDYISTRIKRRKYLPYFLSRTLPLHEFDDNAVTVRVVMGPQAEAFSAKGLDTFLNSEFTISSNFDRMGVRLDGPFVESKAGSDIISDGIALGAIQVPAHGKPIILLADHQTAGGYAKIGTVATVDLPKVAQRRIDDKIRFQQISVEEAQHLLKVQEHEYQEFRNRIHKPCKEVLEVRLTAKRLERLFEE
ncbi:biotin-dependent carboxyltransferase family protein [Oribacterium sp. NK2B42]|uniref:5-oxoprolinase subunit C family protein n=1 Tax=Oribacterium sp. NK2B42 TaxID=689781 RepID=UPI00040D27B9|nr:biotin-dependent carboxyltransferase family protein [Oribacterium sp. NK2B42]MBO5598574.1 biotin-dependent carboxyltransferase family protein [Oribacterium sp.]MBP3803842.1 biotin-dependent carboxyltransferase family protein [Oribacterium sp.]